MRAAERRATKKGRPFHVIGGRVVDSREARRAGARVADYTATGEDEEDEP